MNNHDADILRAAAMVIGSNSDAYGWVDAFYTDRDIDANADDVIRALEEAATEMER